VRSFAACGGIVWVFEIGSELAQMVAFQMNGWFRDYICNIGTFVDWARIISDFMILAFLWSSGLQVMDYGTFLWTFAVCSFYKWIMILYGLTPFRVFGLSIMPILHTMLDVGPFFTVLMFHIFGLMHGYICLTVPGIDLWESGFVVYRLGLMGAAEIDELDNDNEDYYMVTRGFYCVVAFCVTVALMNTFIAALSNSFSIASMKMEILFQSHRADRVLTNMAIRQGLHKMGRRCIRRRTGPTDTTMWFCCATGHEEEEG